MAGRCIRLYKLEELVRESIEPEISRFSLDQVVLTLIHLNYDPLTFPFMDPPSPDIVKSSIQTLKRFNCIQEQDSTLKVTEKGILFSRLPFDPRLSTFVYDCKEYNRLRMGTIIASIMAAPGNIFFYTSDKKFEILRKLSLQSANHDSDLIYLCSVYLNWEASGKTIGKDKKCNVCKKKGILKLGKLICRSCRVNYTIVQHLNNKVLEIVEQNVAQVEKIFAGPRKGKEKAPSEGTQAINTNFTKEDEDIIGKCLYKCFPEQLGELLLPDQPMAGIKLKDDCRGKIARDSTVANKTSGQSELFVAMSVTQFPNGYHIVDKLHPINRNIIEDVNTRDASSVTVLISKIDSVGPKIWKELEYWQQENWDINKAAKWAILQYNRHQLSLDVYGVISHKSLIENEINQIINRRRQDLLSKTITETIGNGTAIVTIGAGMNIVHFEVVDPACSLRIRNVHGLDEKGFRKWFMNTIQWKEPLKGFCISKDLSHAIVILDKEKVKKVRNHPAISNILMNSEGTVIDSDTDSDESDSDESIKTETSSVNSEGEGDEDEGKKKKKNEHFVFGRSLNIESPLSTSLLEKELKDSGVELKSIRLLYTTASQYKVLIVDIPPTTKPKDIDALFKDNEIKQVKFNFRAPMNNHPASCILTAEKQEDLEKARDLVLNKFNEPHKITLPRGGLKDISIKAKPIESNPSIGTYKVHFNSLESAQHCYQILKSKYPNMKCKENTRVFHANLYDMESILSNIKSKCDLPGVSPKESLKYKKLEPKKWKNEKRKPFNNLSDDSVWQYEISGSPNAVSKAVKLLQTFTAPVVINLQDLRLSALFTELKQLNLIEKWSEKKLYVDYGINKLKNKNERKGPQKVKIYGPQINQGQLMNDIAEYSDLFSNRYKLIEIPPSVSALFRAGMIGDAKLSQLQDDFGSKCRVRFTNDSIEIHVKSELFLEQKDTAPNTPLKTNTPTTKDNKSPITKTPVKKDNTIKNQKKIKNKETCIYEKVDMGLVENLVMDLLQSIGLDENQLTASEGCCVFCSKKLFSDYGNLTVCGHGYCRACLTSWTLSQKSDIVCKKCRQLIPINDIFKASNEQSFSQMKQNLVTNYLSTSDLDFSLCKTLDCCSIIGKKKDGYCKCRVCGYSTCTLCGVYNNDLHNNKTCEEFKKPKDIFKALIVASTQWAKENWAPEMPPISFIDENISLTDQSCPSLVKFYKGLKVLGINPDELLNDNQKYFFAWHGTVEQAISPICWDGFDPLRRAGQACGPGEYFGWTSAVSHGYCRNGKNVGQHYS
eukprot:TRINITY_DN8517_c0_g1_i4.p1 TRINITY_DN8517_c0_g1~~TRINITY_DN8517_c0_g1_i4.p1  ORF type:complete len:1293 (+),score=313.93 TRINITY_DN8517_c0_g1_i4:39-3881(+)